MSSTGRTFVFTGPTLAANDVRAVLPDAIVLPPIAATDLWPLALTDQDTLAVIDGFFLQRRAIRHKELIEALDVGATVVGASSMGALRAAELDDFGMLGVGQIYKWYVDGVIEGDDEVALVHGTADQSYIARTLALVNIRAAILTAVDAGSIPPEDAEAIIEVIRSMPFTRRDRLGMRLSVEKVHGARAAEQLDAALTGYDHDLKRADALALLEAIRDGQLPERPPDHPVPHVRDTDVRRVSIMAQWHVSEEAHKHGDSGITPGFILNCARILSLDYPEFHEQVAVAAVLADAHRECGCTANIDEPAAVESAVRTLLEHRGLLREDPRGVSMLTDSWLTEQERVTMTDGERLRALVRRVHTTGWRAEQAVARMAAMGRTEHWRAVAERVDRLNSAVMARRPTFRFDAIPLSELRAWCTGRWFPGAAEVDDATWWIALADRGFVEERQFVNAAKRIHPFALLRSSRYDDLDHV